MVDGADPQDAQLLHQLGADDGLALGRRRDPVKVVGELLEPNHLVQPRAVVDVAAAVHVANLLEGLGRELAAEEPAERRAEAVARHLAHRGVEPLAARLLEGVGEVELLVLRRQPQLTHLLRLQQRDDAALLWLVGRRRVRDVRAELR